MMSKKRIAWILMVFFVSTIFMAGCGSSKSAQQQQSTDSGKQLTTITASHQPCVHALPTYMAMQKGWDKNEGLKIEFQFYPSGPPQNEALASNKWEVGAYGLVPGMLAALRYGAYIIAISNDESETTDLWVRPDNPMVQKKGINPQYPDLYGSAEDVRGKTILMTTATLAHYAVIATLKAYGLNESDVKVVHMEPTQAMAAFEAGQGDIVLLWAPYDYIAESKGWKKISSGKRAGVTLPGAVVASKKAVEENPEKVAKWLKLYMKGIAEMKANPNECAKLLDTYYKERGFTLDEKALLQEFTLRPIYTTQEQLELFKKEDGKLSKMEGWVSDIADFFVQQERISAEEKDRLFKGNHFTDRILKMVAELEAKEAQK